MNEWMGNELAQLGYCKNWNQESELNNDGKSIKTLDSNFVLCIID